MAQRSIGQEQFGFAGREQTISSFGAFADFSANEAKPERAAFAKYRRLLDARNLDRSLFEPVTAQLKSQAVTIKTATLVDATILAPISEDDDDARRVKHKGKRAVHRVNDRIEKTFGTCKHCYCLSRMRRRGLAKAAIQVRRTAIAYNLKRTMNILAVHA